MTRKVQLRQNMVSETTNVNVGRPPNASIIALKKCIEWLDECENIGWQKEAIPGLEALWWQNHDKDGNWVTKQALTRAPGGVV
jgi:hypothetical protein